MYDNISIYDNIFNLGCQIYFFSESLITRILRGCLLVRGVTCLNQDLLDWRIFRIVDLVGLPAVGCVTLKVGYL